MQRQDLNQTALDLGERRESLLVFGGPYSNLEATRALFAWARGQGIAPDNMICTGDIVAYGADAAATVDLVRATGVHCLMGNVEERLAARAGDCGCGFIPNSACDLLAARWYAYADGAIDNAARAWMAALPRRMTFTMAGWRLAVVHGAASAISRFVFASTPEAVKRAEIGLSGADGVIGGHSGLPFSQVRGDRLWHNAGAIGLPANDGTARVWFSTLTVDPADGAAIRIEHRALDYDHVTAARKMRARGLPSGYADALTSGIWPARDILPEWECAQTGLPLAPEPVVWARSLVPSRAIC